MGIKGGRGTRRGEKGEGMGGREDRETGQCFQKSAHIAWFVR